QLTGMEKYAARTGRLCSPPFTFFGYPSCGIRARTLGPEPKKVGRLGRRRRRNQATVSAGLHHGQPAQLLSEICCWSAIPPPLAYHRKFAAISIATKAASIKNAESFVLRLGLSSPCRSKLSYGKLMPKRTQKTGEDDEKKIKTGSEPASMPGEKN